MSTIEFNITDDNSLEIPFSPLQDDSSKCVSKNITLEFLLNKNIPDDIRCPFSLIVAPRQDDFMFFLGQNGIISKEKRFGSETFRSAGDKISRSFCFISDNKYDNDFINKFFSMKLYYYSKYGREACDIITLVTK